MKQLALVSLVSVSMVMSGCAATQQAAQNNSPAKNAGLGALAGAILGAGVSKATGGEKTGRDAAIGAAIGAGVGAYMSRQARQIQTQMAGTGVEVTQDQRTGNINLVMPGNITFAYDDATLNPSFTGNLNQLANTMIEYGQTTITVAGHIDSIGSDSYNNNLSRQRAAAVANYLVSRGVPAYRINTIGYGKSSPIASNNTDAGRAQNRRVELTINSPQSLSGS